jgi:hypothetical protein
VADPERPPGTLPVRLGVHDGKPVFEQAQGLHEEVTGLTVVGGFGGPDPEVMFEEHATGATCAYFEVLSETVFDETLGPAVVNMEGRARIEDEDHRICWHAVRSAFMAEEPAYVNQMVGQLRAVLQAHGGTASMIRVDRRLQRRTATIRMLHGAQAQPERTFQEIVGGPYPLQLHAAGAEVFPTHLYTPLVLLASPFTRGFVAGRAIPEATLTVALVALMGGAGPVLRDGEVTWARLFEDGLPQLRELDGEGTTWLRQTNHHALDLDPVALIGWWTGQLNALYTEATDLGRFRRPDGTLDAGNAYRELRTLDRLIANCVRIQARPDDHVTRVANAFEFFDLLPNILDRQPSAAHVWETLTNPAKAAKILDAAFLKAPADIAAELRDRAKEVLGVLRAETLEHVVPGRLQGKQVYVGAGQGTKLAADVFVGKLFHQLRNTHHGYELEHAGKRDLLNAHTGHISQAFPELAVLYTLAILADPAVALAGDWF